MSGRERIPFEVDDCVTVTPRINPLFAALLFIALAFICLSFVASWNTSAQSVGLTSAHVAELGAIFQEVSEYSQVATAKEEALDQLEANGTGTQSEIMAYYQLLAELQLARRQRAERANTYNGIARNLYTQEHISPMEIRKAGLPTGIR